MEDNAKYFLNHVLGADFVEALTKSEIYKPGTRSVIDVSDIHLGLKLVPRAIMSLLIKELVPMEIGESKEIKIPNKKETILKVTKHERDSFSGELIQENIKITELKNRSIPGCGLVLMSALELYDVSQFENEAPSEESDSEKEVQKMVDERMALHRLVDSVVEGKMQQRDAIQQLLLSKLTDALEVKKSVAKTPKLKKSEGESDCPGVDATLSPKDFKVTKTKKKLPLKEFLDKTKAKKSPEFKIELAKGENVHCPDCRKEIFDGSVFSGCICFGDSGELYIKKSEGGITVRFGENWDPENIEMLLDTMRKKYE